MIEVRRAAVLAAAMLATPALAQDVVADPDWVQRPNADQLSAAFPLLGGFLSLPGRAVIECGVSELGRLERCKVLEEAPLGVGFGAAALKLAPLFQMSPKRVNGRPVADGQVRVPIRFELPPKRNVPPPPLTPVRGPSEEALALARRVVSATRDAERLISQFSAALNRREFTGADEAVVRDAKAAAVEAFSAAQPEAKEAVAAALADTYTLDELRGLGAFFEGPVGRAFTRKSPDVSARSALSFARLMEATQEDARAKFCAKRNCAVPPAPAPTPSAVGKRP